MNRLSSCALRLAEVLLAVVVGLAAASCGGRAKPTATPTPTPPPCPTGLLGNVTSPVDITLWHSMTAANQDTLARLVDRFNAAQDKVRVKLVFQGSYTELRNKYVAALSGGELPDVVQMEDISTQLMIDSGSAVPAQYCVDADKYDLSDFLPRVLAYWTVEGKLWAMPFNVSVPLLYYNKTAFVKAGLDPNKAPASLAEVQADSQKIVSSGAARHGIALELSPFYVEHWFAGADQPLVDSDNGRAGRARKVLFNGPLGLRIFTWLQEMVASKLALDVGLNPQGSQQYLAVATGDAAMTIGTSAALGSIMAVLQSGQFKDVSIGVAPLPGVNGTGAVLVGGAALWVVGRSTPVKQEAARRFIRWLLEPQQLAEWAAGTGYLPIRRSAVELPAIQQLWSKLPEFKTAYDELLVGGTGVASSGPVIGAYGQVRNAIAGGMEAMWVGGATPQAALTQAASNADAAIADYNSRVGR